MFLERILTFATTVVLSLQKVIAIEDGIESPQKDYSGFQVYRFHTDNVTHVVEDIIKPVTDKYDIWTRSHHFIDVQLPKNIDIDSESIDFEIIIDNLNSKIDETFPDSVSDDILGLTFQESFSSSGNTNNEDFFFNEYRNLQTIEIWFELLRETFPNLVKIEKFGTTPDGHDLNAIHISAGDGSLNPDKKTIIITGGIHAREWISISTACYTMYELLLNYGKERKTTRYINSLDFIFVPVFNPDGYEYSWTTDRLWRKNRQETYVSTCPGIDIDRSFGFQWFKSGEFPCSESYNGEEPFSAIEAKYWDIYLNQIKKDYKVFGYLDLHSYAEEILYPYGYSCDAVPRDLENLLELAFGLSKAIRLTTRKNYDVIAACKDSGSDLTPGLGGGSALDYMYHNRAHWALQLKLRDTGNHGFLLPPKFIKPVGKEVYASLMYFCGFILNPEM